MKVVTKFNKSDYWCSVIQPMLYDEFFNSVEIYALSSPFPHIKFKDTTIPNCSQIDKIIYFLAKDMLDSIFGRAVPKFDAGCNNDHTGKPVVYFRVNVEFVNSCNERYLRNILRKILDSRLTIH